MQQHRIDRRIERHRGVRRRQTGATWRAAQACAGENEAAQWRRWLRAIDRCFEALDVEWR
jgi:hypothetical protein